MMHGRRLLPMSNDMPSYTCAVAATPKFGSLVALALHASNTS